MPRDEGDFGVGEVGQDRVAHGKSIRGLGLFGGTLGHKYSVATDLLRAFGRSIEDFRVFEFQMVDSS